MAFSALLRPLPSLSPSLSPSPPPLPPPSPCLPFSRHFLPSAFALPLPQRSSPPLFASRNELPKRNPPSPFSFGFGFGFNSNLNPNPNPNLNPNPAHPPFFQAIAKSQHGARKDMAEPVSIEKVGVSLEDRRDWLKVAISCLLPLVVSALVVCKQAQAAESIKASSLGLRFASFLRGSGWPDEAIVFVMAMLPVLELRGAIPVGYWMHLPPIKTSILAILGNMVPVPFIILYLEKIAGFVARVSPMASRFLVGFYESMRKKAEPIQEFEWLGLMLFVAVPFPGTGAWTGAIAASVLGMPFWSAVSANFFGVLLAGLLVNLLVNLGIRYAVVVGIALFVVSTFMWKVLRYVVPKEA